MVTVLLTQVRTEEESGIDANTCQLCEEKKLYFQAVPILCLCCGRTIKKNRTYFFRKEEEFDAQRCICSECYRRSKAAHIIFNGISISKQHLERKTNNELIEEAVSFYSHYYIIIIQFDLEN
jgi:hypothetical protein